MTTTTYLRHAAHGARVTINHPGHTRHGVTVTVDRPLDRGGMRNTAGFNSGVWCVLPDGSRVALYVDTRIVDGI